MVFCKILNGHISATDHLIYFRFGFGVGERMVLVGVETMGEDYIRLVTVYK